RIRLEHADPDTLDWVPKWYGERLRPLGEGHGVRISITPQVPPGLLAGIDPALAGRDALPSHRENFEVINARTTNWTVVPWPAPEWAQAVHPGLAPDEAVERLWEQLVYVLRLDEQDPADAWRTRLQELHDAGTRIDAHRFDALHFDGPGTDLTVGLLPSSRFSSETPGMQTVDGVIHTPNMPTEELPSTPDPLRADGVVTATKPLDVAGSLVSDLRVRFEGGKAVEIEGENADVLRGRTSVDEGASRLGEVALVDGWANRQDRHRVLQHAARRERGQPSRVRQRLRGLGRRGGPRPHQHERDPHRLHDRKRRRHGHRPRRRRVADAGATARRLAALAAPPPPARAAAERRG